VNRYGFLYPTSKIEKLSNNEFRIAIIGGSTVECMALIPEKRWPNVLERLLNQEFLSKDFVVLNMGLSGQGTRSHLATVTQHLIDLEIDCVVFLIGGNDLFRVSTEAEPMLEDMCFIKLNDDSFYIRLLKIATYTQLSRRLRFFAQAWRRKHPSSLPYFSEFNEYQNSLPMIPTELEGEVLQITQKDLQGYQKNIISLAAVCLAHEIKVLFATQPMLWKDKISSDEKKESWMLSKEINGKSYQIRSKHAAWMLDRFNQRLIQTCRLRGYPFIDLSAVIPRTLNYFYDDVHLNNQGADLVAKRIRDSLISWCLIPGSTK
jgi:lysophospholipase L1-like esterase